MNYIVAGVDRDDLFYFKHYDSEEAFRTISSEEYTGSSTCFLLQERASAARRIAATGSLYVLPIVLMFFILETRKGITPAGPIYYIY